jgi:hypothetical protein
VLPHTRRAISASTVGGEQHGDAVESLKDELDPMRSIHQLRSCADMAGWSRGKGNR